MRIVGAEAVDMVIERGYGKGIKPRVDLGDLLLLDGRGFFLDNSLHFGAFSGLADHSSVTGRVLDDSRENGHRGLVRAVKLRQASDGLGSNERSVAGEHDHL